MRMEQRAVVSQTLAMTAKMQQSVEMLQMNAGELERFIEEEIGSNPFLEKVERVKSAPSPVYSGGGNGSGADIAEFAEQQETLGDVVDRQIGVYFTDAVDVYVARYLAGNLDERGFLALDLTDAAHTLNIPVKRAGNILETLQKFEPTGIFARDLCECLLLQLRERNLCDAVHLHALELMKAQSGLIDNAPKQKFSQEDVTRALADLRSLNPFPGDVGGKRSPRTLVPDCYVEINADGNPVVSLNDDALPGVTVSEDYYKHVSVMLKKGDDLSFAKEKRATAIWLRNAVQKRRETLLKVAVAVVNFQRDYFLYGVRLIRPMTLADVAADVGMHESTVSRAANGKHFEFNQQIIPMKFFFSVNVGSGHSNEAVKARILEIIADEDPKKPLSDQKIADRLEREGMEIARRTVVKYREQAGVPSSSKRKKR